VTGAAGVAGTDFFVKRDGRWQAVSAEHHDKQ
jgi:hypothetical protein